MADNAEQQPRAPENPAINDDPAAVMQPANDDAIQHRVNPRAELLADLIAHPHRRIPVRIQEEVRPMMDRAEAMRLRGRRLGEDEEEVEDVQVLEDQPPAVFWDENDDERREREARFDAVFGRGGAGLGARDGQGEMAEWEVAWDNDERDLPEQHGLRENDVPVAVMQPANDDAIQHPVPPPAAELLDDQVAQRRGQARQPMRFARMRAGVPPPDVFVRRGRGGERQEEDEEEEVVQLERRMIRLRALLRLQRQRELEQGSVVTDEMVSEAEAMGGEDDRNPSTAQYSRRCFVCTTENPRKRAVFTKCGHMVCYPCAVNNAKRRTKCVFCRTTSGFVKIFENEIEKEGEKEEVEKKRIRLSKNELE